MARTRYPFFQFFPQEYLADPVVRLLRQRHPKRFHHLIGIWFDLLNEFWNSPVRGRLYWKKGRPVPRSDWHRVLHLRADAMEAAMTILLDDPDTALLELDEDGALMSRRMASFKKLTGGELPVGRHPRSNPDRDEDAPPDDRGTTDLDSKSATGPTLPLTDSDNESARTGRLDDETQRIRPPISPRNCEKLDSTADSDVESGATSRSSNDLDPVIDSDESLHDRNQKPDTEDRDHSNTAAADPRTDISSDARRLWEKIAFDGQAWAFIANRSGGPRWCQSLVSTLDVEACIAVVPKIRDYYYDHGLTPPGEIADARTKFREWCERQVETGDRVRERAADRRRQDDADFLDTVTAKGDDS